MRSEEIPDCDCLAAAIGGCLMGGRRMTDAELIDGTYHAENCKWKGDTMDDKPLIDKALERIRQRFDTVSEADWAMMDYVDRLARLGASVEAMGKGRDLRHSGSGHWRVLQYAVAGTPYIGLTGFHDDPQNALAEAAPTPEYEHPTSELKGTSCIPCKCIQSCEFCQRHKSYCEAKPTK